MKARGKSKQQEQSSTMKRLLHMSVAISVGLYLFLVARVNSWNVCGRFDGRFRSGWLMEGAGH
eukprot:11275278-Ditylum_brightwellii.AAC.1